MDTNVLHNIGYGMYIVSSFKDKALNGQIANTVFQITNDPATVAISVNKKNLTHEYIEKSLCFSVSILEEEAPLNLIGKFGFRSGRAGDKFKDVKYTILPSGCPVVLDHSIGYLDAKLINKFDCGTHTLFLGRIVESRILKLGKPMTYDFYHQVKHGTTPENAPTFIKGEGDRKTMADSKKYRCTVCNYIYDPAMGDPDSGIAPGTPFEKLPDNWVCPICGVEKDKFVPEGD